MLITIYVSKGKLEGALQLLDQGGRLELYLEWNANVWRGS